MSEAQSVSVAEWITDRSCHYQDAASKDPTEARKARIFDILGLVVNESAVMTSNQRDYVERWAQMLAGKVDRDVEVFLLATYINSCR